MGLHEDKKVKVKKFECPCGKARMFTVIDPAGVSWPHLKKIERKMKVSGYKVKIINLVQARRTKMCFGCPPLQKTKK